MRLGAPIFIDTNDPAAWAAEHERLGYRAAYCPNIQIADAPRYAAAAREAGLVIAEVGAWCNPLAADETERKKALTLCQERLALADRVGARCCVNIAGSRGAQWDGPHPDNLSPETFDSIIETTRAIIDAVRPMRSFYTLETMPWVPPDSIESYERLLKAMDRPFFGVHYDPVNLINSPERYFHNAAYTREFIRRLGPLIRSVHAKDILLTPRLTVHLDEVLPGQGGLDYPVLLRELAALDPDLPLMCEHLPTPDDYGKAVGYLRGTAFAEGVALS